MAKQIELLFARRLRGMSCRSARLRLDVQQVLCRRRDGQIRAAGERAGARIFIEPLNRYQNDVCVTIADALRPVL